ncbi:MAG: hypothetical protein R3E60_08310 [Alphaproteobacteria bacterium]
MIQSDRIDMTGPLPDEVKKQVPDDRQASRFNKKPTPAQRCIRASKKSAYL